LVCPPHIDETAVKIVPKPIIWTMTAMSNLTDGMALCDLWGIGRRIGLQNQPEN